MKIERHAPIWLQCIAMVLGFLLTKALFQFTLPVGSGIFGVIFHVIVFLTPYAILNWIYFAVGRR